MFIKNAFIDPLEKRLRAGWRLFLQFSLQVLLGLMFGLTLSIIPNIQRIFPNSLVYFLLIELLSITLSIYLARRFLDKRSFSSLGLKANLQAGRDLLAGLAITALMMGLIYLLEWSLGWLHFQGFAWEFETPSRVLGKSLWVLLAFVMVGWHEELLSRGYHLQTIASGLNLPWGVIISSIVFGALHSANPNASWISMIGITLAGFFLAFAYLRTRQLWLPIGLHIGWNFFEGVVFGFPVSGMDFYNLVHIRVDGPEIITGGAFGPEAGLVLFPALLLGTACIWWYSHSSEPVAGS